MTYKVTIDTGGTFTDVVISDSAGEIRIVKTPTTPDDPHRCIVEGLNKAAEVCGTTLKKFLADCDLLIFGTTLGTNALLTKSGTMTGMITTEGFKDILYFRTGKRIGVSVYDYKARFPEPLVPGYLRREVQERIGFDGGIITPLNEDQVSRAARFLKASEVDSIAICFMHSYINPVHELKAEKIVKEICPESFVTVSSRVLPHLREYDRFSTTVISAMVGPKLASFLGRVESTLRTNHFKGSFLIMQANGGVASVGEILERPGVTIGSGPSAGPVAAVYYAENLGLDNLVSSDMGGTSFDVSVVRNRAIGTVTRQWYESELIAFKAVDFVSIGAGGGSIAWFDQLGLLRVGPKSAGASPGPACYGKGGMDATVTDADVVLGHVPYDYYLGGEMTLNPEIAREVVSKIGKSAGLDTLEAADAIYTIINSKMAGEVTSFLVGRGFDPREFVLVAGGGASPAHSAEIAKHANIHKVFVPKYAAHYCAFGMQQTDLRHDYEKSYPRNFDENILSAMNQYYNEMEATATRTLISEGIPQERILLTRTADMRYAGQHKELEIPVPSGEIGKKGFDLIVKEFNRKHQEVLLFSTPENPIELLYLRVTAFGKTPKPSLPELKKGSGKGGPSLKRRRECYFGSESGLVDTAVYDGSRMKAADTFQGPAIVEETTYTVVVPPGWSCTVGKLGDYELTPL